MGVLGNNAKTVIKNLNDGENCEFEPKSGYDTETTVAADDQLMTKDVASVPTIESSDANNKDNAADIFNLTDVNGFLIGGASLEAESFYGIYKQI